MIVVIKKNLSSFFISLISILFFFLYTGTNIYSQETIITGLVLDEASREPLPFANVIFKGTSIGTTTDFDGRFTLKTDDLTLLKIEITFLGYKEKVIKINPGTVQNIEVLLKSNEQELEAVVVKTKKRKRNKDTLAIRLYRKVLKNKIHNAQNAYAYFQYEDYTKTEFDIFNYKEKFKNNFLLKPFDFVFENTDTIAGKPYLPVLIKERISEIYYRKNPAKRKEIVKADQFSGVDDVYASESVDYLFTDHDIYQNIWEIGGKGFISPFADGALLSYVYYLTDSTFLDNQWCYKLEFTPRRKQDLCFTGHAWIHDTTAAVKKVELYLLNQANLNYVSDFKIKMNYNHVNHRHWFKNYEQLELNLNITKKKKHMSLRILKTATRDNVQINQAIADTLFDGDDVIVEADAYHRKSEYWDSLRHGNLSKTESGIYMTMDRIQKTRAYKNYAWLGHFAGSMFMRAGPVEIGRVYQFYSWNAIEGNRYRFGLRANRKMFRDKFDAQGHIAYGDKDSLFKYNLALRVILPRKNRRWHAIGGHYRYDWSDFNVKKPWLNHDNILVSALRRNPLSNLFLIRQAHVFYEKEWLRGFMNRFAFTHQTVYAWPGSYDFGTIEGGQPVEGEDQFETLELELLTRWTINQKRSESGREKKVFATSNPVLELAYTYAPKGLLGSDYGYHKLNLSLRQRITTGLGKTNYQLQGGKTFGQVPYPLLKIHKGNESYTYNKYSYNAMNEFEYVNDMYASFWFWHQFDGLIFNAIPLIKKLKMRSLVTFKGVAGNLSADNQIYLANSNGLKDLNGFYAEVGVGIENIAFLFRVDFVWRLTQLNDPMSDKWRVKFYFSPGF